MTSSIPHRGRRTLIPCVVILLLGLAGCQHFNLLRDEASVRKLTSFPATDHRIVSFDKSFTFTPDGRLLERTYSVTRVGENPETYTPILAVEDESNRKLLSVEGRVLHVRGLTEKYSTDDFFSINLSNGRVIADVCVKSVPIEETLHTGDLVELCSVHENIFPEFGISFSPGELDYPADNITCSIEIGRSDSLRYKLVNGTNEPAILDSATRKYVFRWDSWRPPVKRKSVMEKRNRQPAVIAVRSSQTWQSFGDWYLRLISPRLSPDRSIIDIAAKIVAGKQTAKEKMDAIFDYCQRNVRYEQVYLEHGAIVPNRVGDIFAHKYGDCKDYASLMYAMAVSVGLKPHLALCRRGRGVEFYDDMPVSQFNHAILHFNDGGTDCWYDGTNRAGIPGVPTFDMANARALILENGNSSLATMKPSVDNMLAVTGNFSITGESGLKGDLTAVFSNQYAVDLFWLEQETNRETMGNALTEILKDLLNENIAVESLTWTSGQNRFTISAVCEIPNSVSVVRATSYLSYAGIFPKLLPSDADREDGRKAFYFPYYGTCALAITVAGTADPGPLRFTYNLPPGPFTDASRPGFLAALDSVCTEFATYRKLRGK